MLVQSNSFLTFKTMSLSVSTSFSISLSLLAGLQRELSLGHSLPGKPSVGLTCLGFFPLLRRQHAVPRSDSTLRQSTLSPGTLQHYFEFGPAWGGGSRGGSSEQWALWERWDTSWEGRDPARVGEGGLGCDHDCWLIPALALVGSLRAWNVAVERQKVAGRRDDDVQGKIEAVKVDIPSEAARRSSWEHLKGKHAIFTRCRMR